MSIATNLQGLFNARTAMQNSIKNKDSSINVDGSQMQDIADLIRQIGGSGSGPDAPGATNGETWIRSNITSSKTGNPIYGLGVWAAGTHYSTDGKNWIECTSAGGTNVLRRYDQSTTSGGFVSYSGSTIYYSADGKTWTSKFTVPDGTTIRNITYSNSRYVGCSQSYTFTSTDGSSWSSKQWFNTNNPDCISELYSQVYSSNTRFIICAPATLSSLYGGPAAIYESTNGSSWSVGVAGGNDEIYNYYMCPNGDYYATRHNQSAALEVPNKHGGIYYNGTRIYSDPADIDYSIGSTFGNYVTIGSGYGDANGAGVYYNGAKVSRMSLSSAETGIQNRLWYDHNDGDRTYIPYKSYSSYGKIYTGYYNDTEIGAITADNGVYIDQAGYFSRNATEWIQCQDDADKTVTFSAPPIYANGIWVAKSNRGLIYSLY